MLREVTWIFRVRLQGDRMILGWLPQDISTFGPSIDPILKLIIYVVGAAFILAEGTLLAG